ncbi:allatostatin-A receptor-like [Babylonia areolata]|uniref:allatostatin-A receptor-like n=1 Tax=Babylonia areolata TaxID=304850 RepID=UPI003FD05AC5
MEVERLVRIIVPTIFGVIVLLGLLGNLLVISVVLSDKHMRNTTNILILSLAVADLLFIIFCVPFTATALAMPVWPFGKVWCKVVQYMIYVCAYASVYTLVLMSLDRYLAVVHAIRSMSMRTEYNTWLAVAITWVIILLGHVPLLFEYDILHYEYYDENRTTCTNMAHMFHPKRGRIFFSCFLTFGYVVPLGVVCCLYGLMLKRLLYGVVPGGNQSQESIRAKKRVTRMVIIVVIIFAVCWLPIQIILVMQRFNAYPDDKIFYIGLKVASNCLAYMNSCVNPFLYAFLSDNFRRSFRKLLCCGTAPSRRMDYERTNIRYNDKDSKTLTSRTVNHV